MLEFAEQTVSSRGYRPLRTLVALAMRREPIALRPKPAVMTRFLLAWQRRLALPSSLRLLTTSDCVKGKAGSLLIFSSHAMGSAPAAPP